MSDKLLRFTLPLQPTDNNAYRTILSGKGKGGRVLAKASKAWKERAALKVHNAAAWARWDVPEGELGILLVIHFGPRHQRQDPQNRQKLTIDAVSGALGFDDSRFGLVVIERGETRQEAAVDVTIGAMEAIRAVAMKAA